MPVFIYNDIPLSYAVYGKGTAVLLLHGFGEDSTIWHQQVNALKDHCQLIVPDLAGSGHSALMTDDQSSLTDHADHINALIAHLGIEELILLGHSMGGYITLAFAERYPEKLQAFGLIHSTAFADTAEKIASRRKGIEHIQKHGAYSFLKASIPNLFSERSKTERPGIVNELVEKAKAFSNEALIQYYEAMIQRPDRTNVLKGSEIPVLFILGTEDQAAPLNDVLQQVHLPKTSYIHILENVGHMGMLEAPDQVNGHLLQFIKDVCVNEKTSS